MASVAPSTSLNDFKQLALLGEGAYSSVFKVRRLADGETYALKKVKLPSLSDKEKNNALNEIRLLASVNHENVISYKEAFFDDRTRSLCIVTECADAGDLLQRVNRCQKERRHFNEQDLWRYLVGMARGLQALHELQILHRDMKSANVFLSTTRNGGTIAKLGDFNVSAVAKRGLCMTQTGTPYYASPEVWRDMPYDSKSDIWSLGCVVYEACALKPPFQAQDMEGLYRKVLRGQYPRIPHTFTQELGETIAAMIQVNPRNRPTAVQLLDLPSVRAHHYAPQPHHGAHGAQGGGAVEGGGDAQAGGVAGGAVSESGRSILLSTIKVPKNILDLPAHLPMPRYITHHAAVQQRHPPPSQEEPQPSQPSQPAPPSALGPVLQQQPQRHRGRHHHAHGGRPLGVHHQQHEGGAQQHGSHRGGTQRPHHGGQRPHRRHADLSSDDASSERQRPPPPPPPPPPPGDGPEGSLPPLGRSAAAASMHSGAGTASAVPRLPRIRGGSQLLA